jgi:hypothetical protein
MTARMNRDTVLGILRHLLTVSGGALAANGTVSSSELEQGIGAILTLVGIAWSIWNKRQPGAKPGETAPTPLPSVLMVAGLAGLLMVSGVGCATKTAEVITTKISYNAQGLDVTSPKDITWEDLSIEDPEHGIKARVKGYTSTANAAALETAKAEQAGQMAQLMMLQQMIQQFGAMAARAYGIPTGPVEPAPKLPPTAAPTVLPGLPPASVTVPAVVAPAAGK